MNPELDAFCRREHPRLVGALTLHCGDRWVAADLAQEVLAQVCADWSRVSRMQSPGAWVHRVAMNLCTSHFRRRTAERAARARYQARQVPEAPAEPAEALAVRRAVGALPVRQRTALVLRYYSDLTIEQTAAAMNVAPGTVKSLTHQALAALRTSAGLTDHPSFDDEEPSRA